MISITFETRDKTCSKIEKKTEWYQFTALQKQQNE